MRVLIARSRWLYPLLALALFAAACGTDDGGDEPVETDPVEETDEPTTEPTATDSPTETETGAEAGGTVVFGADQEPTILNQSIIRGNEAALGIIVEPVQKGPFQQTPEFEYVPTEMLTGEPEVTSEDPLTIDFSLNPEAVWSDGEAIDAEDFVFTQEVILNPDFDIISTDGYDIMTIEVTDPQNFTVSFSEPYAPWRTLFTPILPQHVLVDQDFDTIWEDELPIANGPYMLSEFNRGESIVLVPNPNWYGATQPSLEQLVVRFLPDSNTQIQALTGGEVDFIYPQAQIDLIEQAEAIDGIAVDVTGGPSYEHIDFQFDYPPGALLYVRQAIAQAIDRQAIVDATIVPINPEATPLGNLMFVQGQLPYVDNYAELYPFDPEAAIALLETNGCTRGDDQIFTCEGQRLEFDWITTGGNQRRELTQQVVQQQLQAIGVAINIANLPGTDAFEPIQNSQYELAMFGWVGNSDPGGKPNLYGCETPQNWMSYCNEEVTALLDESLVTIDADARNDLLNQADVLMAADLPSIPLFQSPSIVVYRDTISGIVDNPTTAGPLWNLETWTVSE